MKKKKSRPCWQHSDFSGHSQPVWDSFQSNVWPRTFTVQKDSSHVTCSCQTWTLKRVKLTLDVKWHAHGHNQRRIVSFVYLIAWISETDRVQAAKLFHHSLAQINVSRTFLMNTGIWWWHDVVVIGACSPNVLWQSNQLFSLAGFKSIYCLEDLH